MGWFLGDNHDGPEELRWITDLEHKRRPPLNTLFNICANYVANHLEDTVLTTDYPIHVRPQLSLPIEVAQTLWNMCPLDEKDGFTTTMTAFTAGDQLSPSPLPLSALDFSLPNQVDSHLLARYLSAHGRTLVSLNVSGCTLLTSMALVAINEHCSNLKYLIVGKAHQIFQADNPPPNYSFAELMANRNIIHGPKKLEKLVVHSVGLDDVDDYDRFFLQLVSPYQNTLTYLDLSGCDVEDFHFLVNISSLRALILYHVDLGEDSENGFFAVLPLIRGTIQHLDLSQPLSKLSTWGTYYNPNELLDRIVRTFPEIMILEISGTNLAGDGVAQQVHGKEGGKANIQLVEQCCDIPGLNFRSRRPLEYLGLYGSAHGASHRHCIPAKVIGGDKDELQIISAARVFMDRHEVLERILNDLFELFRTEAGKYVSHCLRLILCAMERHPTEKHIQISGSASLFYIVKNNQNVGPIGPVHALKRRILDVIVRAMEQHVTDSTMMRNGCLTICHFKIPQDVMFVYEKLVKVLLETLGVVVISQPNNEDFNERIAIYLLNSLACQVEGEHKRLVGNLGAIHKMLGLIQNRLIRAECDDVMEIAWSTMWNVTDETPENCSKFLEHNGMALFLQCLKAFPNQPELLRNMMGLLGNVAEVPELRGYLMREDFIKEFYELLNSRQDNIEVSYNAAGVLAHILSDGEEAWAGVNDPTRDAVCLRMSDNIRQWSLDSLRNINYRSFKPILRLLLVRHTMQCRLWAAWALANLTNVYPEKYVTLLEEEEGLSYLTPQLDAPDAHTDLVRYARIAYNNVLRVRQQQQQLTESAPDSDVESTFPLLG